MSFFVRHFCQIISNRQKNKTSPGFFSLPPKATAFCTKVVKAVLCKSSGTFGKERMFCFGLGEGIILPLVCCHPKEKIGVEKIVKTGDILLSQWKLISPSMWKPGMFFPN